MLVLHVGEDVAEGLERAGVPGDVHEVFCEEGPEGADAPGEADEGVGGEEEGEGGGGGGERGEEAEFWGGG